MLVSYFFIAILEGEQKRFESRTHLEANGQTKLEVCHLSVFTWRGLAFIQCCNCCRFLPQKRWHKRSLYVCMMEKAHAFCNNLVVFTLNT